jgi:EmrB/QacA subfamily drug resistance transporter
MHPNTRMRCIIIAMGTVGGLILLDETVIGIALPSVQRDLGMTKVASHWVVSAYLVVFTAFAAAGGKLGDIFGLKNVFAAGLMIFAIASLAAGLARNSAWLITARACQGLGASVIFPMTMAIVVTNVPKEKRGWAIGTMAAIGTAFLAAGPLIGGFFTETLSWRYIFWINLPIAAFAFTLAIAVVPASPPGKKENKIDLKGLTTLVLGMTLLVLAIMQGAVWGWTSPAIVASLAIGTLSLAAFVYIETSQPAPLINISLFKNASFTGSVLVAWVGQFSKMVIVVFGAIYLQETLKMSPLNAGWALLASVILTPFTATPAGRCADKFGARSPALAGLGISTVAVLSIALATSANNYLLLLPGLVLWGAALPFCFQSSIRAISIAVPPDKQGQAGGINITVRLLGGTFGMALGSTVLSTTGSFFIVFAATAALMFAVLVFAFVTIARSENKRTNSS